MLLQVFYSILDMQVNILPIRNIDVGMACLNSQISASIGALSWVFLEWSVSRPSVPGALSGAIAGLVAIAPSCGWVDQTGAFFIGLIAGPWCYLCAKLKSYAGYDDALDAFGVHATGGLLGVILTGFFANPIFFGPYIADGMYPSVAPQAPDSVYYAGVFYAINKKYQDKQLGTQAYGCFVTIFYSLVVSTVLLALVDLTMGLRSIEEEDIAFGSSSLHGETVRVNGIANRELTSSDV
jgi:Amt family ammonium transporter